MLMRNFRYILMIAAALFSPCIAVGAASFSAMSVEEVSSLLAQGEAAAAEAATAKVAATVVGDASAHRDVLLPVSLTAIDMVSKIFGVIPPEVSKDECVRQSQKLLCLTPEDDCGALWLETGSGYGVDYYGMSPEVSAMARFADNAAEAAGEEAGVNSGPYDFGFFFLFPYTSATRQQTIRDQADFCGSLLQEMADSGLAMDLDTATDDLFEAVGDYRGSLVDVRLLDERQDAGDGRYILILSVEPHAF